MFFPVKADKLSGLLRRYKNRGYPKVEYSASSTTGNYVADNVFDFDNQSSHWASNTSEGLNAHFDIKIVSGVLRITHYSIRSHKSKEYTMRAWTLEGSNDNNNYVAIDDRPQNSDLNDNKIGQYQVNSQNNYYQYFRIKQTVKTTSGMSNMRISNLDFYGEFLPFKLRSCRCYKNRNFYFVTFINILLSI